MLNDSPIKAVLWDFDGTLADTRMRNLSVNRRIVEEMTGRSWREVAALSSGDAYLAAWNRVANWQELYTDAFGLRHDQLEAASQKWAPYQLDDATEVPLFEGIRETLDELKDFPQAVVSQNDRSIIAQVLEDNEVDRYFSAIIGFAEVPSDRQKPAPDGLLRATEILGVEEPAIALYIGDHETDILSAANANRDLTALGHELRFRSVAATYANHSDHAGWSVAPDHHAGHPREIAELIESLDVFLPDA
jgi:HAD superfamily hydrolase (TIGR01549 family)